MIRKDDHIVTAWATNEKGPGWENSPVWVLLYGMDLKYRLECIQPDDQDDSMRTLHRVSSAIHQSMTTVAMVWVQEHSKEHGR